MSMCVLNTKGQIAIPSRVRSDLGVTAGSRFGFVKTGDGWLIKPATFPTTALKGVLKRPRKPVSIEDMNRAIRRRGRR